MRTGAVDYLDSSCKLLRLNPNSFRKGISTKYAVRALHLLARFWGLPGDRPYDGAVAFRNAFGALLDQSITEVSKLAPPDFRIPGYLNRWYLTPRSKMGGGPAIYLHQFLGDDEGQSMHDHRADVLSLVLAGGYTNSYREFKDGKYGPVIRRSVKHGRNIYLGKNDVHRLSEIEQGTWTLLYLGPPQKGWGFLHPGAANIEYVHGSD